MSRQTASRIAAAIAGVISFASQAHSLTDATPFNSHQLNQDCPLCFTENKGQWDERVLFKANGAGGLTWFIERDGFTVLFSVLDTTASGTDIPVCREFDLNVPLTTDRNVRPTDAVRSHALKFKFQNVLPRTAGGFLPEQLSPASATSIESTERLSWNNNYFLGNDPSKWAADCGNYQKVVLKDVWSGIDVQWRWVGKAVEFDFVVAPGADASQIRVECLGLTGELEATADGGELLLPTSLGVLRQALPEAFQIESDGSFQTVQAEFKVEGGNALGVDLPNGHDSSKLLIVDPLVYSTYLGGSGINEDCATSLISDELGGVFVAGYTGSDDFPTTAGAYNRWYNGGALDIFITAMSPDGSDLYFSTYLGGSSQDNAYALVSDGIGGVIIAGRTYSHDFPTTSEAIDSSFNGGDYDVIITRLSGEGSELLYSSYFGGEEEEWATAIAPDGAGGVFVTGGTSSPNFPTTEGVYDRSYNGGEWGFDTFVAYLNPGGSEMLFSTFLGGREDEWALAITSDSTGGIFVGGWTLSDDFPITESAFDVSFNGGHGDVFVSRLNSNGSDLLNSTYIGGNGQDGATALVPDGNGGVIVGGTTSSQDFPVTDGAYDRSLNGSWDVFVTRLSDDLSELSYCTYLGGENNDYVNALTLDTAGRMIVVGSTNSAEFPTTVGSMDRSLGGYEDAFIVRFESDGSRLLYSSYLGGSRNDVANALALGKTDEVVVVGTTASGDFPITENAFDREINGPLYDAFITKFDSTALTVGGTLDIHLIPNDFHLETPYPNPFNNSVRLTYRIPVAGHVRLSVFDISGREVARLADGNQVAGFHAINWTADAHPTGIYLAKLESAGQVRMTKLTLLK